MKYILDSVDKVEEGSVINRTYFIHGKKIKYVNEKMDKLRFPRLNANGFTLTPGYIMNDFTITEKLGWEVYKERMLKLIKLGCTTVVIYCDVPYEKQLLSKLNTARHRMINSSIDYVVGVSTTIKALSPSFIRRCKRERVPIILLKVNDLSDLSKIAWPRIKEAMLSYSLLIIPTWDHLSLRKKESHLLRKEWSYISEFNRIPTCLDFPEEYTPFSKNLLKRTGIYPQKGEMVVGSDVDYNLFLKENECNVPEVVVAKGKILKAGQEVFLKPGYGKEMKVDIPGQFVSINDAYDTSFLY